MKNGFVGFGIGMILVMGLYFFWHVPEVNKSYKRGLADCKAIPDTVIVTDTIEVKSVHVITKPLPQVIDTPFTDTYRISRTFISKENDTIKVKAVSKDIGTELSLDDFVKNVTQKVKEIVVTKTLPCDSVDVSPYELQPFSLVVGAGALSILLLIISMFAY